MNTLRAQTLLTPRSRFRSEKLTRPQAVNRLPAFYKTWRFTTAFTTAHHLSLSWAISIQSMPPRTSRRSILILSSHLRLGLPSGLLLLAYPTKTLYVSLLYPYVLHVLSISIFLTSSTKWYLVRSTEHKAPCYVVFSTPMLPRTS
jgi:hypothetical protein